MVRKSKENLDIREFILHEIQEHSHNIASEAASHFEVSRVTINRYLKKLVLEGMLVATGSTKAREYQLKNFVNKTFKFPINEETDENLIWREKIFPYLTNNKQNIIDICHYGVTEMVNNIKDHSQSEICELNIKINAKQIIINIKDTGIGIFENIRQKCNLVDPRHALLELSKGKLTTDPRHHSGEGVFFTSRMFDIFVIWSGILFYNRKLNKDDWLIEIEEHKKFSGTFIELQINIDSSRTTQEVFDYYTDEDYKFSYTHVPILLAKYGDEQLISRSQAKRVLARFENFSEVMLDFQGISQIGRAFTDEIFRVFKNEHPEIKIVVINATPQIEKLIQQIQLNDKKST